MIEYISSEQFPDDPYTKEIVKLSVDSKFRFSYVRKAMKNGGLFWAPISIAVTKDGNKKYLDSIEWDSNFLKQDILAFLDARSWENKALKPQFIDTTPVHHDKSTPSVQMSFLDDCPF